MKKIFKINLLFILIFSSMMMCSCFDDQKVLAVTASGYKTEFFVGEDFSIDQQNLKVEITLEDNTKQSVSTSDLIFENATLLSNEFVSINFSNFKKQEVGEYEILVTYLKYKDMEYKYKVNVVNKNFEETDYSKQNYDGVYDGLGHSITLTQSVDGIISYGLESGNYNLTTNPSFCNVGTYEVFFKIEKFGYFPSIEDSATVNITKAELKVIAKDQTIKFNEEFVNNEVTYQGFVNGEDEQVLSGNLVCATNYTKGSDVGEYDINYSGLEEKNYKITYTPAKLTVIQNENTLQVEFENVNYGNELVPVITNLSNGELSYKYQKKDDIGWLNGLPSDVGEYTIKVVSKETLNFTQKTIEVENVKILKALLKITPNQVNIKYNEDFVSNGVKFEGFVKEENESVLNGTLQFSTNYEKGNEVGEYEITILGYENCQNYELNYQKGKLLVSQAVNTLKLTIDDVIYGSQIEYIENDKIINTPIKLFYKVKTQEEYSEVAPKNVGVYDVKALQSETTNYQSYEEIFEVEIKQREVVLSWQNTTFTYDSKTHLPTATVTNLAYDDICTVNVIGERIQANEIGYEALANSLSNQNYCLPENKTTNFVINKVVVNDVLKSEVGSKNYTGKILKSDIVDSDYYTVFYNKGGIDSGLYPTQFKLKDSINYKWSSTNDSILSVNFEIKSVNDNEILNCEIDSINYGETLKDPIFEVKYGNPIIEYKLQTQNNNAYTQAKPTDVGNYTLRIRVIETESYNFCMTTKDFSIFRVTLSHPKVSKYEVSKSQNLYSIVLPASPNGSWQWKNSDYIFSSLDTEDEKKDSVVEYADFIPNDRKNYYPSENVTIFIDFIDETLLEFDSSDIVINDKSVFYNGNNPDKIDVELKNSAQDALVEYSLTEFYGYASEPLEYIDIGEYEIFIKISKEGYKTYYTSATLTIFDAVCNIFVYDRIALMQGTALDISNLDIECELRSTERVILKGSEFEIKDFDPSIIGEQHITFLKDGFEYQRAMQVRVYAPFVDNFALATKNENNEEVTLTTTKLSSKSFDITFDSIQNFEISEIEVIDSNENYISAFLEDNTIIEINEGSNLVKFNAKLNIDGYYDFYTINVHFDTESFKYSIDEKVSTYDAENDSYTINNTIRNNYKNLTSSAGEIVGAYPIQTTIFNSQNNLLTYYSLEDLYFSDYPELVIVSQIKILENAFLQYSAKIKINRIDLPVSYIKVNDYRYELTSSYETKIFKVEHNEERIIEIENLDKYFALMVDSSNNKIWLDKFSNPTKISLPLASDETKYFYYICLQEGYENSVIQTIEIVLKKDDYIDKFTITDYKDNIFSYEKGKAINVNDSIKNITIIARQNYTYKLLLNNVEFDFENIENNIFVYGNNILKIIVYDSKNEICYQDEFVLILSGSVKPYYYDVSLGTSYRVVTEQNMQYHLTGEIKIVKVSNTSNYNEEYQKSIYHNGNLTTLGEELQLLKGTNDFKLIVILKDCASIQFDFSIILD